MHLFKKSMKFYIYQWFNQTVSNYFGSGYVYQFDLFSGDLIPNVMVLDVNIFGPRVKDWVMY